MFSPGPDVERKNKLQLFCSEATLPGSSMATANLDNDFTGVSEKYAHRRQFDEEISLTFYCDAKEYLPIRYFEAWMSYMTNDTRDRHSGEFYYRMKFPAKYKGGLEITKFEKNLNSQDPVRGRTRPLTYKFIDAFPKAISAMPISYAGRFSNRSFHFVSIPNTTSALVLTIFSITLLRKIVSE